MLIPALVQCQDFGQGEEGQEIEVWKLWSANRFGQNSQMRTFFRDPKVNGKKAVETLVESSWTSPSGTPLDLLRGGKAQQSTSR